ncbi:MAG: nuclear transport factor 2 family protein [Flavobacteriales bacterium]|nr:nuclear transport factor 2 family protein [Flavobacteriales bacterium]
MKKTSFILCILLLCFSCQQTKENTKEKIDPSKANVALVQDYFRYFNQHEWKSMANLYFEKALFKDPSLGIGIHTVSRQEIVEKYSGLESMFPDVKDSIVSVYPSGKNNVIVEFVSTGRALDGTAFRLPICTIFTIESGKITKDFTYYDNF